MLFDVLILESLAKRDRIDRRSKPLKSGLNREQSDGRQDAMR
jgi:hypothetical protein